MGHLLKVVTCAFQLILVALQACFLEHNTVWNTYRNRGYWKDIDSQRAFFDQLAIKLNIQKLDQWYTVRASTVINAGGYFLNRYYNGSMIEGKKISVKTHLD
jgi:hypothetical protein